MKKAVIQVKGGLGNQMFFFAFGEFLKRRGFIVRYAWHEYVITKHHYGVDALGCFNIRVNKLELAFIKACLFLNSPKVPFYFRKLLYYIISFKFILYKKINQKTPYAPMDINKIGIYKKYYFNGFWQNIDFLKNNEYLLKEFFKFNLEKNNSHEILLQSIKKKNSIGIHIRRGDYLSPAFDNLNVINGIAYYNNAISYISKKIANPYFYVFSDDMDWVKLNLKGENIEYIENSYAEKSYLDMYLMSQCKHNIISNSTFSFWAAFLNANQSKIIVCPDYWEKWTKSKDIWEKNWIYLKANY
jgi:hypothetical protein